MLWEEIALLVAIALLTFWQVLLPVARDRPVFPVFRQGTPDEQEKVAKRKLAEAEARLEVARLGVRTAQTIVEASKLEQKSAKMAPKDN